MNQVSLDQARHDVLEDIFGRFDFGDVGVESRNGWEHTSPGRHYSCVVFLEDENDDFATRKVYFNVVFESNDSLKVEDVYAIDTKGNMFGYLSTT